MTIDDLQARASARGQVRLKWTEGIRLRRKRGFACADNLHGGIFRVEPGAYDVVVINPDGSRAKLEDGFRVISLCGAGSGTALLATGLMLGLVSAAGTLRLRSSRRKRS